MQINLTKKKETAKDKDEDFMFAELIVIEERKSWRDGEHFLKKRKKKEGEILKKTWGRWEFVGLFLPAQNTKLKPSISRQPKGAGMLLPGLNYMHGKSLYKFK